MHMPFAHAPATRIQVQPRKAQILLKPVEQIGTPDRVRPGIGREDGNGEGRGGGVNGAEMDTSLRELSVDEEAE